MWRVKGKGLVLAKQREQGEGDLREDGKGLCECLEKCRELEYITLWRERDRRFLVTSLLLVYVSK